MAEPFATPSDLQDRWRELTEPEITRAEVLLGDASRMVRRRFPGIDARITPGDLDPDDLVMVVAGMVKRAMLGLEDGVSEQSETVGPFSTNRKYTNPLGNLYLSAADIETLEPAATSSSSGKAFSIDLAPGASTPPDWMY